MSEKVKRCVLVGVGSRGSGMFLYPIVKNFSDSVEIVALCDINPERAKYCMNRAGINVPIYTDFNRLLKEIDCDVIIVSTPDYTHHEFIIAGLKAGKDVITEKPLTTDEQKCRDILKAEKESGKSVTVTFNLRFVPYMERIKKLLLEGKAGEIFSIDLDWYLDARHGASYFRRWHATFAKSSGLLVHKSTHHFDLVNWFLEQKPERVYADGQLRFYGANRRPHGERCLTCTYGNECNFYWKLNNDSGSKALYLDHEHVDGYWRDRCLFSDHIDIYDTISTMVKYDKGTVLNYTLSAYLPYEGWRMAINGSKGRLECGQIIRFYPTETPEFEKRNKIVKSIDPWKAAMGDFTEETTDLIRFYPIYGGVETISVPRATGSHGGGDERLLINLFRGYTQDPLKQMASSLDGAMSMLVGVAANKSISTGNPVTIKELFKE